MALKSLMPAVALFPLWAGAVEVVETEKTLVISHEGKEILAYQKAEMDQPKGVDPIFRRSGFIHPLNSPKGGAVTGIHPDDHYHHLGIWHAWVKTVHGDDHPDFWNLKTGTGRVRFVKVLEKSPSGFTVEQEQVAFKGADKKETVVLRERLKVAAEFREGVNIIDYTVTQSNVSGVKLELPAYRYGGPLAWRGPLDWNAENSDYLTSAGKKRADSHQSRAHWVSVHGPTEAGQATLVFLCHPSNHDAPQRLRTWPDGKMFLNWVPIQETPFAIGAGDTVSWKFQLIVADGQPSEAQLASWWGDFSQ
ncbi:PmoA family protein [Verrucomicrobiaceae bacterium 227]